MQLQVSSEARSRRLPTSGSRGTPAATRVIQERVYQRQLSADTNIAIRVSES
jgi:hypothetical protein